MADMNNKELDSKFAINKESFLTDFLPFYKKLGIKPRFLVQFPVLLPFELPFKGGTCNTFGLENGDACTLHYSDVITTERIYAGIISEDSKSVEVCKTRVEMTYVTQQQVVSDQKFISDIFDELVTCLNWMITAYKIYKKDIIVYQVSREMFEFASISRVISVDSWDDFETTLFLTNNNVKYRKEKLSKDEQYEITRYSSLIFKENNPFILAEDLLLSARHNLNHGFYRESVVFCQSFIETFLSALFTQFLEIEGKTEIEIMEIVDNTPFMGMVKKEFHSRLGGNWSYENSTTPVGEWYERTYKLRNRVAHAGYSPRYEETSNSIESAMKFRKFVIDKLLLKKKQYSQICNYFHLL